MWTQIIEPFTGLNQVTFSLWIILITAVIYLFLHRRRYNTLISQLSIVTGFIPVLVHETGHALAAVLTKGRVENIYMVLTPKRQAAEGRQGYAVTRSRGRLSSILITFSGYAFPPLLFIAGIFLLVHELSVLFILILILLFLFYLFHTSQKWLPLIIIIILAAGVINMMTHFSEWTSVVVHLSYNVILGLLLGEMIQSIFMTARINFKNDIEWDGAALRRLTYLPAVFWWFIWTAISVWSIYQSWHLVSPLI